jgi:hypothetical protein
MDEASFDDEMLSAALAVGVEDCFDALASRSPLFANAEGDGHVAWLVTVLEWKDRIFNRTCIATASDGLEGIDMDGGTGRQKNAD